MNLQLQFQMLLYEAESEGVPVDTAKRVQFDSYTKSLVIDTEVRRYVIIHKSIEEKSSLKKRRPIVMGPDALAVMFHISEMGERPQKSLVFRCPTFPECVPKYARFMDGSVQVRFTSVQNPIHNRVQFEGFARVQTDYSAFSDEDLRVYSEYDAYAKSGWMSADLFSALVTHRS